MFWLTKFGGCSIIPKDDLVYLKKKDTLALADRLQSASDWSRSEYIEMLDSLKE